MRDTHDDQCLAQGCQAVSEKPDSSVTAVWSCPLCDHKHEFKTTLTTGERVTGSASCDKCRVDLVLSVTAYNGAAYVQAYIDLYRT